MRYTTKSKSDEGSALIGVVVLMSVMAIAGAGLMQLTVTGVNIFRDTEEDIKQVMAAESGLNVALRQISKFENEEPDPWQDHPARELFPDTLRINGYKITVDKNKIGGGKLLVIAYVYSQGDTVKSVEYQIDISEFGWDGEDSRWIFPLQRWRERSYN
ncbi:MAG: hypothetical protein GF398_12650 [Chitinivibrionales bacterium]|nr:hypothetical protein [Chitinivibrionales bacterium]